MLVLYTACVFYPRTILPTWIKSSRLCWYGYELLSYDALLKKVGIVNRIDSHLTILGIDDPSIEAVGQWPWPRSVHGTLVRRLAREGAAAISFDVLFADPGQAGPADDALLARAIGAARAQNGGHPLVVLACRLGPPVTSQDPLERQLEHTVNDQEVSPLPIFLRAGAAQGFIDEETSLSQTYGPVLRTVSLARRDARGQMVASLDLQALAVYQKLSPSQIIYGDHFIRVGRYTIPTNARYEMFVAYYPVQQSIDELEPVSYVRALGVPMPADFVGSRLPLPRALVKGRLFLVGATASALGDMVSTPVGRVAGVYVHAQVLNTIMTGSYIRETPLSLYFITMLAFPVLLLMVISRTSGLVGLLALMGAVLALAGLTIVLFAHGWWLRPLGPLVTLLLTFLGFSAYQFIRGHMLLRQFITPELAHDLLLAGGTAAHTTECDCTIIFSDIRGFTTLNERVSPSTMVRLLKEYHSLTVPIYEKHGGRCLDYLGDAQMVVYGDPSSMRRMGKHKHAVAALAAGLEVCEAIDRMNERWVARGDPPFEVGIGCCSGNVAVGVLGADTSHLQYTAIGDVTNTAARVQGLSRDLHAPVIAAESTIERAGDEVVAEKIRAVSLKGKSRDVTVYRILGLAGDEGFVARMRARVASDPDGT